MTRAVSGATALACVVGDPVRHSVSPALHNAAFAALDLDWVFLAFEVPQNHADAAIAGMRALGVRGASVTMPHKEAAMHACDEVTSRATMLRSVNCITRLPDGRLRGDSTDGDGFVRSLTDAGVDVSGRTALLLGAGGAARAVAVALCEAGTRVSVSSRRAAAADTVAGLTSRREVEGKMAATIPWDERATAAASADIVVNATPIGMLTDGSSPLEASALHAGQAVIDLVYTPLNTPLLMAARSAGAQTVDGLGMLVHQAAIAFEHWTGLPAPVAVMRTAAEGAITPA
ncbi:MAG TPA: shikimate dehydrogenase [Acidimicrobiia bacterium]|jgi:shikimate dehydrogenase